jgi:CRP-like cAMP-binding protein
VQTFASNNAERHKMPVPTALANLLLANFYPDIRHSLLKNATRLDLPMGTVLYQEDSVPRYAYFLLSGLASVLTVMPDGEASEVGFIGREGVVGSLHLLGPASLPTRCTMQLSGSALRVPLTELQQAFDNSPEVRGCILEFVQEQSAVAAQIAGCNRIHDAEQRLVRCLLMAQDRTKNETLDFTHEYLSQIISTQRSTVTIIAGGLQRRGLIRYSRGRIHILDRPGLAAVTCVCSSIIYRLFSELYAGVESRYRPSLAV